MLLPYSPGMSVKRDDFGIVNVMEVDVLRNNLQRLPK